MRTDPVRIRKKNLPNLSQEKCLPGRNDLGGVCFLGVLLYCFRVQKPIATLFSGLREYRQHQGGDNQCGYNYPQGD